MWSYGWFPLGSAAFILVFVNLARAVMRKHGGWQALLFGSLSCGALTMLCALQMVNGWLQKGDWSAIEDAAPAMSAGFSWALCLGLVLNLLALRLHRRAEKVQEGTGNP